MFKQWLMLSERMLYHGTTVDNEKDIRDNGLIGNVGDFVRTAYDDQESTPEDEVVYMADKHSLDKALTAMVHHIGKKLNKNFHDVTDNDILNHGLLVKVNDEENRVNQRPKVDDYRNPDHPQFAEPGDYYSDSEMGDQFVKGRALLRLFKRYGVFPRTYGPDDRTNELKSKIIQYYLRQGHPKQEILSRLKTVPDIKKHAELLNLT